MRRSAAFGLALLLIRALALSMPRLRSAGPAAPVPGSPDGEPGPAPGPEPGPAPRDEEPEETRLEVRPDPLNPKAEDARWKVYVRIPAAPADGGGEEGRVPVGAYYKGDEHSPTLYSVTHLRDSLYSSWPEDERPVGRKQWDVLTKALSRRGVERCLVPHPASDWLTSSYIHLNDVSVLLRALGCKADQRNRVREERPPCDAEQNKE